MLRKTTARHNQTDQRAIFIEIGCEEDEKAFEDKLKKIARQRPKSEPKKGA